MTEQRHRQPKGIRVGGQYAAEQRSPSQVVLDSLGFTDDGHLDPDWDVTPGEDASAPLGGSSPDEHGSGADRPARGDRHHWGASRVEVGTDTPWGPAEEVAVVAPGITRVDTTEHGGWRLSRARNAAVPNDLREESGWYELDSAWAKAAIAFPDEPGVIEINQRMRGIDDRADADGITHVERVVRDHYPYEYERFTGRRVLPGQSTVRDREFTDRDKLEHRMNYRAVTDDDRQLARHMYEQIGPVVAGNMDAKARKVMTIPHGMLLQGCRSGTHRVDVAVRHLGMGLREVVVFDSRGAVLGSVATRGPGRIAEGDARNRRRPRRRAEGARPAPALNPGWRLIPAWTARTRPPGTGPVTTSPTGCPV